MTRNTSAIIFLTFLISACCEKEGSWLNTIVKNHAAKIAASAAQESIVTESPSALSANAAAISDKPQHSATVSNPDSGVNQQSSTAIIRQDEQTAESKNQQPDSSVVQIESINNPIKSGKQITQVETSKIQTTAIDAESVAKPVIETATVRDENHVKPTNAMVTAPQTQAFSSRIEPDTNEIEQTISNADSSPDKLSKQAVDDSDSDKAKNAVSIDDREPDRQQQDFTALEKTAPENTRQTSKPDYKTEKLSDLISLLDEEDNTAIDKIIEQTKPQGESGLQIESEANEDQQLLELLSKDIDQTSPADSKISRESLELLDEILSD